MKPANLLYGVDESPPLLVRALLAVQHVSVMSVGWVFVVVLASSIGAPAVDAGHVIRMSMIASGVATILQARTKGPVGSGMLCPFSCGPSYLAAAIVAGKAGGLPLVFGMTMLSGLFEGLFSRVVRRLRMLFPPEVTGLIVAMVGIELVALGCSRFLGGSSGPAIEGRSVTVGLVTLAAMVAPTIWGTKALRLLPVILGLGVGYAAAYAAGILTPAQAHAIVQGPMLGIPSRAPGGLAFDFALLAPFLVASLSSALKTVGDLTLCQKVNDTNWTHTDMKPVGGGILAGAIGSTLAGALGGVGQSTFSSNVGLSIATGVTSRSVALPIGILLVALAFLPGLAAVFTAMPAPVIGALLVYVACFMILGGFQVVTSRMLDARRTFAVGIAFIFGLSVRIVPEAWQHVPEAVRPLVASSLSLATILVVLLNALLRLGIGRKATLRLEPGMDGFERVAEFLDRQGRTWGMRPGVVDRANDALHELVATVRRSETSSPIDVEARYDEFNFDLDVSWDGELVGFDEALPSADSLAMKPDAFRRLSAFLVLHYADRVSPERRDGRSRVLLHFDH